MSYAIRYYRDEDTVARYRIFGGVARSVGYVVGRDRFRDQLEADKLARHLNEQNPAQPAIVVKHADPYTVEHFVSPEAAADNALSRLNKLFR